MPTPPPTSPPAGAPSPATPPAAGPATPGPSARPVAGRPGIGSISTLAFVVILVPGIGAYLLLRLVGLAIGPAGLLGLLVMFISLGLYPPLLVRLGWVPPRRKRSSS